MATARLSSRGRLTIPKTLRDANAWRPGMEFVVESTVEGILLRPAKLVPRTTLEQVAGILKYKGKPATIRQMDAAIARMVKKRHRSGRY